METHERLYEVLSHDLVAWARRGDDARMTEFASGIAAVWAAVDADQMAKARSLMDRLIERRNEDLPAELAEARAIMADRAANWTEMRDAVQHGLKLDGNQLRRYERGSGTRPWRRDGRGVARRLPAASDLKRCCGARQRRRSWRRYVAARPYSSCFPSRKRGNAKVVED